MKGLAHSLGRSELATPTKHARCFCFWTTGAEVGLLAQRRAFPISGKQLVALLCGGHTFGRREGDNARGYKIKYNSPSSLGSSSGPEEQQGRNHRDAILSSQLTMADNLPRAEQLTQRRRNDLPTLLATSLFVTTYIFVRKDVGWRVRRYLLSWGPSAGERGSTKDAGHERWA